MRNKLLKPTNLLIFLIVLFIAGFAVGSYLMEDDPLSNLTQSISRRLRGEESPPSLEDEGSAPQVVAKNPRAAGEVTGEDYVLGDLESAKIIFIEYGDLNCHFCAQFHEVMKEVMDEYGEDVAWVYRHYPLLGSQQESESAECVGEQGGNDAFWEFVDSFYTSDVKLLADTNKEALVLFADGQGYDISECLEFGRTTEKVAEDMRNAREIGLQGTPSTVLIVTETDEYELLSGAYSSEDMIQIIGSYLN